MTEPTLNAELGELAAGAAAAVVTAMATEGWEAVRHQITALFRSLGRSRAKTAEHLLEHHDTHVRTATEPDAARRALLGSWTLELAELLRDAPEAADRLRALTTEPVNRLTPAQREANLHQVGVAHDHGRVFAVQQGNVYLHPRPGRAAHQAPDGE